MLRVLSHAAASCWPSASGGICCKTTGTSHADMGQGNCRDPDIAMMLVRALVVLWYAFGTHLHTMYDPDRTTDCK